MAWRDISLHNFKAIGFGWQSGPFRHLFFESFESSFAVKLLISRPLMPQAKLALLTG